MSSSGGDQWPGRKDNSLTQQCNRALLPPSVMEIGQESSFVSQLMISSMDSLQVSATDESHFVPTAHAAAMKQGRMPLTDGNVEKIKSKMELKRRIELEVISSHFAAIGIIRQKPMLDFDFSDDLLSISMRTKRDILIDQLVPVDQLVELLRSVVVRFRKLRSISVNSTDFDLTKAVLDSLVSVASSAINMEIRRFSAVKAVDDVLQSSFVQFAAGLRRLKLRLLFGQFQLRLNDTIQAVGLCLNLRHLDLFFGAGMVILKQQCTTSDQPQPLATTFANFLISLPHLHTLRLIGIGDPVKELPPTATRHTLTIGESWLSFISEPAFEAVVKKMENFEMNIRDLPLSYRNLALLSQLLKLMPPSSSFNFYHEHDLLGGSYLLTTMNEALANWLLLANQTQKHIQLNVFCPMPSAEEFTKDLESLPNAGIVESKVVEEDGHFYFQYGNGGRLAVKCNDDFAEFFDEGYSFDDDDNYMGFNGYDDYDNRSVPDSEHCYNDYDGWGECVYHDD